MAGGINSHFSPLNQIAVCDIRLDIFFCGREHVRY